MISNSINTRQPYFIAEIKPISMWGYESKHRPIVLLDTALEYGDWISVHTDSRFGGSYKDINKVRNLTKKPILAKGFHTNTDDITRCFDDGADYVLSVDTFHPEYNMDSRVIYEVSRMTAYWKTVASINGGRKFLYNGRDIKTGKTKSYIGDYSDYRSVFNWLCGASLIQKPSDVQHFYPDCDAFIVGTHLVEFCQQLSK